MAPSLIDEQSLPAPVITQDPQTGIKIVVEYGFNEKGQKVKITRKIKTKLIQEHVNERVAERKSWAKFGAEKGKPPGPDLGITSVGEQIFLKLSLNAPHLQVEDETVAMRDALKGKSIACRYCKGDHLSLKCPYKDALKTVDGVEIEMGQSRPTLMSATSTVTSAASSKYVAPHMRSGDRKPMDMSRLPTRDDSNTIRITNLSEDTQESDVSALCKPFGSLQRVYMARDRETNLCRGFAFVTYIDHEAAARAIQKLNGHGYDNLILTAEWAKTDPKQQ